MRIRSLLPTGRRERADEIDWLGRLDTGFKFLVHPRGQMTDYRSESCGHDSHPVHQFVHLSTSVYLPLYISWIPKGVGAVTEWTGRGFWV